MQAERDPFAAGAAAELGRMLLEADDANEKRQTSVMNELDEKIARGDAGLKLPRNAPPAAASWPGWWPRSSAPPMWSTRPTSS